MKVDRGLRTATLSSDFPFLIIATQYSPLDFDAIARNQHVREQTNTTSLSFLELARPPKDLVVSTDTHRRSFQADEEMEFWSGYIRVGNDQNLYAKDGMVTVTTLEEYRTKDGGNQSLQSLVDTGPVTLRILSSDYQGYEE